MAISDLAQFDCIELIDYIRRLLREREPSIYRKACAEVDRVILKEVLNYARGNQVLASELLGMSRTTLRAKIQTLGFQKTECPLFGHYCSTSGQTVCLDKYSKYERDAIVRPAQQSR